MSIGSDIALQRICGELVDMLRLDETASAWIGNINGLSAVDKTVALFEVLTRAALAGSAPEDIARMCGCSLALVNTLQAMGVAPEEDEENEEEDEYDSWMEGLDHEAVD